MFDMFLKVSLSTMWRMDKKEGAGRRPIGERVWCGNLGRGDMCRLRGGGRIQLRGGGRMQLRGDFGCL